MNTNTHPLSPHEQYIHALRAKERQKKTLIALAILLLIISGVGGSILWSSGSDEGYTKYVSYKIEELRIQKVEEILAKENTYLVVTDPINIPLDTIKTPDEYYELMRRMPEIPVEDPDDFGGQDGEFVVSDSEFTEDLEFPATRLTVDGVTEIGEILTFTIDGFDEDFEYELEYGNSVSRRIGRVSTYAFPNKGRFTVFLRAQKDGIEKTVGTYYIEIYDNSISDRTPRRRLNRRRKSPPKELADSQANQSEESPEDQIANSIKPNSFGSGNANTSIPSNDPQEESPSELPLEDVTAQIDEDASDSPEIPIPDRIEPLMFDGPVDIPEKLPKFPGGAAAFSRFISKNLRYPQAARDHEIEGKVYIQFVVETDGTITESQIQRGLGYGCDDEALRVMKLMPKWIPGEIQNQKVPVRHTIGVDFRIVN